MRGWPELATRPSSSASSRRCASSIAPAAFVRAAASSRGLRKLRPTLPRPWLRSSLRLPTVLTRCSSGARSDRPGARVLSRCEAHPICHPRHLRRRPRRVRWSGHVHRRRLRLHRGRLRLRLRRPHGLRLRLRRGHELRSWVSGGRLPDAVLRRRPLRESTALATTVRSSARAPRSVGSPAAPRTASSSAAAPPPARARAPARRARRSRTSVLARGRRGRPRRHDGAPDEGPRACRCGADR